MTMANSGTVPFRMEATAESIVFSPHEMRAKGRAVFVRPSSAIAHSERRSRGNDGRRTATTNARPAKPNSSRQATNVNGPTSPMAILIHKKEDPQINPNRPKANHSFSRISTHLSRAYGLGKLSSYLTRPSLRRPDDS